MQKLKITAALIALMTASVGAIAETKEARGELYGWGIGHNMQNKDEYIS